MVTRLDAITINPVDRVDRAVAPERAGDARQQALSRSLQAFLGKSMQAEVLSRLTDGSFVVRVAGNAARMQLPAGAEVGGKVDLTLLSLEPRPTFQVGTGAGSLAMAYPDASTPPAPARPGVPALLPAAPGLVTAPALAPAPPLSPTLSPALAPGLAPALAAGSAQPGLPLAQFTSAQAQYLPGAPPSQPGAAAAAAANGAPNGAPLRASAYAAVLLSRAPLVPADQLPGLDADTPPAALSQAGLMISSVLRAAPKQSAPLATVVGKLPLLPGPAPEPARLATALQDAVGNSGLFYESHLAEWAAGNRPLAALLREPQMQGALVAASPKPGEAAAADPATAQFINQQLSAQEQGRVAWQGQLWPGQDLRWEISRDRPGGGQQGGQDGGEPAEAPWRSGVRFRFPLLGEIAATLVLAGDQLHIDVEAGAGEVRDLLRAHSAALGAALEAAGSPLASLTVRGGADATDG